MSSGPHEVDIPIRDLDERDDLFRTSEDGPDEFDGIEDPLAAEYNVRRGGFAQRLRSSWNYIIGEQNEYHHVSSQSMDLFSDDEGAQRARDAELRNYRISRLNQRFSRLTILVIFVFVAVISLLLLPHWNKSDGYTSTGTKSTKRLLSNSTHKFYPTTIIVSLDGFHPHYINASNCPSMHEMLADGYAAPYMTPQFPSSTFPNHWTLVTGLYPSEHGIVGNTFYDPKLDMRFVNVDPKLGLNPKFWEGGEPIWQTAARQGVKSAVHMWPGSEVPNHSPHKPLYVDKFNKTEVLSNKADRVFEWLDTGDIDKRPELMLTYVPTVDTAGHAYGVGGQELTDAIRSVDDFVALLRKGLTERHLDDIVNLVIVSDHGMAPTSKERLIFIDDIMNLDDVAYFDGWPLVGVRPKKTVAVDAMFADIEAKLAKIPAKLRENYRLYRVEDIPEELNFGGESLAHKYNFRLAPIWIIPDVGYSLTTREKFEKNDNELKPIGVHGYNNTHLLMRAIFLSQGPYFKMRLGEHKKVKPFNNLNIYNLVCDGLDLEPSPNNGSLVVSSEWPFEKMNLLPNSWSDESVYPGVSFGVDHVVFNATYDTLWRESAKLGHDDSEAAEEAEEAAEEAEEEAEDEAEQEEEQEEAEQEAEEAEDAEDAEEAQDDEDDGKHKGLFGPLYDVIEDGIEVLDDSIDFIEDGILSGVDFIDDLVGSVLGDNEL